MPIELSMYHQHVSTLKLSLSLSQLSTHTHTLKTHQFLSLFTFSPFHLSPFPILETLAPVHPLESFRHFALVYLTLSHSLCLFPISNSKCLFLSLSLCSLIFVEVKALQAVLRTRFRPTSHPFLPSFLGKLTHYFNIDNNFTLIFRWWSSMLGVVVDNKQKWLT